MNKFEVIDILNFYRLTNKLKTTLIDEDNNYSIADHIFGSMLLAVAMDSEFNETNNLEKVLRMLFLNDFIKLNPDYDLQFRLKKGEQFISDLKELKEFKTKESKLAFKYKMLDLSLTKLIEEKANTLNYNELTKEAIKLFIPYENYQDYTKYEKVFQFYYHNFRLKNKVRSGWDKNHWNIKQPRIERISEHIIGTIALALAIDSEFEYNLNNQDILKTLVIHETGEILIGDITPFDGITKEQKIKIEKQAIKDIISPLTKKEELIGKIFEFMDETTIEAIFAHYVDKIEADLQSKYYQDSNLHHSLDDQANNCVFKSPKVQTMLENGATTAFDIWYEYDKTIYQDSDLFPEFIDILQVARDNNLLRINHGIFRESVNIDKNTHNFLVNNISKILNNMLADDNIDCVFLENKPRSDFSLEEYECHLIVLLKDNAVGIEYLELIRKYNNDIFKANSTNIEVRFYYDYVSMFEPKYATNLSTLIRLERLSLGSILFDKSGKITKFKEMIDIQQKDEEYIAHHHIFDYNPPIDKPIIHKLKKGIN